MFSRVSETDERTIIDNEWDKFGHKTESFV